MDTEDLLLVGGIGLVVWFVFLQPRPTAAGLTFPQGAGGTTGPGAGTAPTRPPGVRGAPAGDPNAPPIIVDHRPVAPSKLPSVTPSGTNVRDYRNGTAKVSLPARPQEQPPSTPPPRSTATPTNTEGQVLNS